MLGVVSALCPHSAYHEVRARGLLSLRDNVGRSRFSSVYHSTRLLSDALGACTLQILDFWFQFIIY